MSSIETCLDVLSPILTENRKERFETVLDGRTRHIAMVLEDVYQGRNSSAVMRTADGFGLQDIHLIEKRNAWSKNKSVSKGASNWLTIHRYTDEKTAVTDCVSALKSSGYRVVATSPHHSGYTPSTLPLDKPVAIVMGTELTGISDEIKELADDFIEIPMCGFSESFNISVASAIIMSRLSERLHEEGFVGLSEDEKQELRLRWAYKTVKDAGAILNHSGAELPFEI